MVRCNKCNSIGVIRTLWTPKNPRRRFYCCSKRGSDHEFIDWYDEEMCECSVVIIPGLLRSIKQLEVEVAQNHAIKRRMKMMLMHELRLISSFCESWTNKCAEGGLVYFWVLINVVDTLTNVAVGLKKGAVGLTNVEDGLTDVEEVCDWLTVGAEGLTNSLCVV
ncbi:hypothetical protein Tco_0483408 [Tanacetum coccineum]